jgi:ribosomal protein L40E
MDQEKREQHSKAGCVGMIMLLFGLGMVTAKPIGPWSMMPAAWCLVGIVLVIWHLRTNRLAEQACRKCGAPIPMRSFWMYAPTNSQLCKKCNVKSRGFNKLEDK